MMRKSGTPTHEDELKLTNYRVVTIVLLCAWEITRTSAGQSKLEDSWDGLPVLRRHLLSRTLSKPWL
jgi:hypothetical protein